MRRTIRYGLATFVVFLMLVISILPITASEGDGRSSDVQKDTIFYDDFSTNSDWEMNSYWEIGALGPNSGGFNGADPLYDHSPTFDNQCLGSKVPGSFKGQYYQYRWATSPEIDCKNYEQIEILHWGHDHTDYIVWQNWFMEAKDINGNWHRVWHGYQYPGVHDRAWKMLGPFDVSDYADDNPNFQIRFGYYCRSGVYSTAGRNIDDFELRGISAGIPAEVRIEPQSLNLNSLGNYITLKVEDFPDNPEYSPNDVDPITVSVECIDANIKSSTFNNNRFVCKVDRLTLEDAIGMPGNDIELEITGQLYDGTKFIGTAVIKAS